jgi:CD109 antigen
LLVTAVPEGGAIIPHLENQIFVLVSYPDGSPATAALTVHIPGGRDEQISTDSGGVGVVSFNPRSGVESLQIEVDDHHGNRVSSAVALQTREGTDQILLRTSHGVVKEGDRIQLKILSTHNRGVA